MKWLGTKAGFIARFSGILLSALIGLSFGSGNAMARSQGSSLKEGPVCPPFWRFEAAQVAPAEVLALRDWYWQAEFRDVSARNDLAQFAKGPAEQGFEPLDGRGLQFRRAAGDAAAHSMLEIAVDDYGVVSAFGGPGGYRSMALGVPYDIELEFMLLESGWSESVPWAILFQGHAIPDLPKLAQKLNPPFALVVSEGALEVHMRADARRRIPENRNYQRTKRVHLGSIAPYQTTNIRISVTWAYEGGAGELKLYREGILLYEEHGEINFFNVRDLNGRNYGPYLTFGLYIREDPPTPAGVLFSRLQMSRSDCAESVKQSRD